MDKNFNINDISPTCLTLTYLASNQNFFANNPFKLIVVQEKCPVHYAAFIANILFNIKLNLELLLLEPHQILLLCGGQLKLSLIIQELWLSELFCPFRYNCSFRYALSDTSPKRAKWCFAVAFWFLKENIEKMNSKKKGKVAPHWRRCLYPMRRQKTEAVVRLMYRSSCPETFCKNGVLRNFT